MRKIDRAARHLFDTIRAPCGSVGVLTSVDAVGQPILRVFVDPMYWLAVKPIPEKYEGFKVVVERKPTTAASAFF
jgi:hypothetical protein